MKTLPKKYLFVISIIVLMFLLLLSSCSSSGVLPDNEDPFNNNQQPEAAGNFTEIETSEEESSLPPELDSGITDIRVGLYNGVGSWDLNVQALKNFLDDHEVSYELFDENDVASNNLIEQFDLIWFPGGFAAEYRYYIPNLDHIIQFVSSGGSFIGSCAGAYFAADILRWLGEDQDYPLNLFPGRAAGPLVNEIGWGEETSIHLSRELPVNEEFNNELPVYYFDGPYFAPAEGADVLTVASYGVNSLPAVVAGRFGAGSYLLFGPHPELGGINPETGDYDLEGGNNAQWSWLFAVLDWFSAW